MSIIRSKIQQRLASLLSNQGKPSGFDPKNWVPKEIAGPDKPKNSFLKQETTEMADRLRELRQQGERAFAKVIAKDRSTVSSDEMGQTLLAHPLLNRQLYDGKAQIDPEALRKFQNERNEQERAKQHRLGLALGRRNQPKPRP